MQHEYEVQDLLWVIFDPDPQEITLTDINIITEDVVTREYYDGTLGENVNSKEAMLTISIALSTTLQMTQIDAYDILTLLGDIGGASGFFVSVFAPIVGWIIGDRFVYVLLKSLYMQNRQGSLPEDEFDQAGDDSKLTAA